MSKPYTETEFCTQITEDRNWRIKEISDLKNAIRRGDDRLQRVLLRALVAICYAHWEGSVRFSARKYLEHVALRRLRYQQLDRQFFRNYFLPKLAGLPQSRASISERCKLVDEILNSFDQQFSKINEDLVNTKANLNFCVFSDICLVCGVPAKLFEDRSTFIDVMLLKRRNGIAHGEDTFVSLVDLDELVDGTLALMRMFGDTLENHVVLRGYESA